MQQTRLTPSEIWSYRPIPSDTLQTSEWIQQEILEAVSSESEPIEGNNVYVSRSGAVERRVLNENEVMNVLSEYGFERYCLENQSLSENVQLFSQADLVVGPHGAGLTDIIFANDCTLLELFGEKVKQPYELLAETLGVNYEPMYCQADSADVVVDTEQLELRVWSTCREYLREWMLFCRDPGGLFDFELLMIPKKDF